MMGPPIEMTHGAKKSFGLELPIGQIWAWPENGPFLYSKMEMGLAPYLMHLDH